MIHLLIPLGLLVLGSEAPQEHQRILKRATDIRLSDTEKWRTIPWTATLLDAAEAARREAKPMFVFSHEGNIDTGRC